MLGLMMVSLDFIKYWNGEKNFLPPTVAVFFGLICLFLALVASYSCLTCINWLKRAEVKKWIIDRLFVLVVVLAVIVALAVIVVDIFRITL